MTVYGVATGVPAMTKLDHIANTGDPHTAKTYFRRTRTYAVFLIPSEIEDIGRRKVVGKVGTVNV
jgi:hypothetical protein